MPKQYGPKLGSMTFSYNDPCGETTVTDDRTGQEVVFVSKVWLDGVLAGARYDTDVAELRQVAEVRLKTVQNQSVDIKELRRKLDREVASHRENCKLLYAVEQDRDNLNKRLNEISEAFMTLHNLAKAVVGPKPPVAGGYYLTREEYLAAGWTKEQLDKVWGHPGYPAVRGFPARAAFADLEES